jgi:predicted permease
MDTLLQDLRYGFRMLLKAPGFTAVAVLTLALGIGANTAVFSIVNAVLLRPLPYQAPGQLVKIWGQYTKEGIPQNWISEPEWWDMQGGLHSFSSLAAYYTGGGANLSVDSGQPTRITQGSTTASLFPLLGVKPYLGRTFSAEEDKPNVNVVLLSYKCWHSTFGADAKIVGTTIDLNLEKFTVIGVLPEGFVFAGDNDVWTPLGLDRAKPGNRGSHYLEVIGRIKPGVTLGQANADLQAFANSLALQYPRNYGGNKGWGMFARSLRTELTGDVRLATLVLFGAVGFVLLIACVNLANLLLARASARSREMALRIALGAGRFRLIRQHLTESVLIGCIGGAIGVFLAVWGVNLVDRFATQFLPAAIRPTLDIPVLGFAAALSIFTGFLFGLAPALHVSRTEVFDALRTAARSSAGVAGNRMRNGLVVAEISVALVLLIGAGLMVRSLRRLMEVNPGFQTQHLLTARLYLPSATYKDQANVATFFRDFLDRVRAIPGVTTAGAVSLLPVQPGLNSSGSTYVEHTSVEGLETFMGYPYIEADRRFTSPDYFSAMQIPLVRGRYFTSADDASAPLVAIVDDHFAKRFWPGQDAIGQHIAIGSVPKSNPPVPQWTTVVGVVRHVNNTTLDFQGREQVYVPHSQLPFAIRSMSIVVRTPLDPAAIASAVRGQLSAMDPTLPLYEIKTMDEQLQQSTAQRRFNMTLLVAFGLLALLLAGIGTYGVLAYSVGQRTPEIGVRLALGAHRRDILKMVIGDGLRLAAFGLGIGLIAALIATRFMSTLLFGVGAFDAATFAVAAVVLTAIAMLAAYVPARRATRVDPMVALRNE